MKCPTFLPIAAVLFAAISLPTAAIAQSTNVKVPNKNQSAKFKSAIFKGSGNLIESNSIASFIGGGQSNTISLGMTNAVIGGGLGNLAGEQFATVAGGWANRATGFISAVGGGNGNSAASQYAVVGGGLQNTAGIPGNAYATVAGGVLNTASGSWSTVGGGSNNSASGVSATIAGGTDNKASNNYATVGGGSGNTAGGDSAMVGGGTGNTASGNYNAIGGGVNNTADGTIASVVGGQQNKASGYASAVGGGEYNTASGDYATVPGGNSAMATNNGVFVWNGVDSVLTASTNDNSFTVRAPGGVRFISTLTDSTTIEPIVGGNNGVFLAPNSGAWASLSDSNAKTKITAINPRRILAKIAAMPVTEWEYKAAPDRRYIGPMAQDFHAAFGLGNDDKSITTLDSDGVMYAAIQGLVAELRDRDAKIAGLESKIGELDLLKAKFEQLQKHLETLPPKP